jgi:hypothetical protein
LKTSTKYQSQGPKNQQSKPETSESDSTPHKAPATPGLSVDERRRQRYAELADVLQRDAEGVRALIEWRNSQLWRIGGFKSFRQWAIFTYRSEGHVNYLENL